MSIFRTISNALERWNSIRICLQTVMTETNHHRLKYRLDPVTGSIVDENGKPCKTCNTFKAMQIAAKNAKPSTSTSTTTTTPPPTRVAAVVDTEDDLSKEMEKLDPKYLWLSKNCPPDVEILGSSSWNLLHSIAAKYPTKASNRQAEDTSKFFHTLGELYPCGWCAQDFTEWMKHNPPVTTGQEELGQWLCRAHNEVNKKLGKPVFDCSFWRERWVTGSQQCQNLLNE